MVSLCVQQVQQRPVTPRSQGLDTQSVTYVASIPFVCSENNKQEWELYQGTRRGRVAAKLSYRAPRGSQRTTWVTTWVSEQCQRLARVGQAYLRVSGYFPGLPTCFQNFMNTFKIKKISFVPKVSKISASRGGWPAQLIEHAPLISG